MGKRKPYRIRRVNSFSWSGVLDDVREQRVIIGVDVAKEKMAAAVLDEGEALLEIVGWSHPRETAEFMQFVDALRDKARVVEVAMEPSGVYGDALRWQLLQAGVEVHRVSPKKSSDAKEIYDGVPSSHDAKSAAIVAWLHFHGKSDPWPLDPEHLRALKAALWRLEVHAGQFRQNQNRLEALTARHWPELTGELELDSATLLELLAAYGSPAAVAADPQDARALMQRIGRAKLDPNKVERVLVSAPSTTGMPQISEEVALVRDLAAEARRNQREMRAARKRVEELAEAEECTNRLQKVVGKTTAAVIVAAAGDPRTYDAPQALVKSLGLNLKERSSGEKQNRGLHITKRGSGTARMYLYMASLRLIQHDPVVRAWYAKKVKRDGGRAKVKAVVAVTRKLALALWHVARGEAFDASKLFDTRRLSLSVRP